VVASNSGYVQLPTNNYTDLMNAVATKGPIAISVAAGGFGWQLYFGGIMSGSKNFDQDHAVQLVGYGTDGAKDYWLVRNSWGNWGEKGYIRLQRFGEGKEPCGVDKTPGDGSACAGDKKPRTYCGECGILSPSSYPTGIKKATKGANVGATDDVEWGCRGSGDPVAATCYEGSAGALGVKETVKVNLKKYATGAGSLDLTGTGVKGFTCSDHAFTKSGQDVSVDLSDCLPSGITVPKLKYCSSSDTIAVTVKDKAVPIPISTTLKKVTCSSTIVV